MHLNPASYDLVCPNGRRTHCQCEWSSRERMIETAKRLISVSGLLCKTCDEEIERVEEIPQA